MSNGSQLMGKRFMANLHASLDSTCKIRISKISTRCQNWGVHYATFDPELRNESFAFISFMGFPCNIKCITACQICIFNRKKNSKLTFSNGSQLMGKRFMANLHASLDSTCKSRISKISTRCQNWGVHSTTFDPEPKNEFQNFSNQGSVHSTTVASELRNEFQNFSNGGSLSTDPHTWYWLYKLCSTRLHATKMDVYA